MGKYSDYKKDTRWTAWDMNCPRICPVKSKGRRKLRDVLRRQMRKKLEAQKMRVLTSEIETSIILLNKEQGGLL